MSLAKEVTPKICKDNAGTQTEDRHLSLNISSHTSECRYVQILPETICTPSFTSKQL
jgi:hypothetical protein